MLLRIIIQIFYVQNGCLIVLQLDKDVQMYFSRVIYIKNQMGAINLLGSMEIALIHGMFIVDQPTVRMHLQL